MPLVGISLFALFGLSALVVDIGVICARKQMHVNGCDAAALAGAWELPDRNAARTVALEVATANRLAGRIAVTVSFPSESEIVVESQEEMPVAVARVFGIETRPVGARARAVVRIANRIRGGGPGGLRPWALDDNTPLVYGRRVTLKDGYRNWDGSTDTPGNFYPIRFGGLSGADAYLDHIRYGSPVDYQIGDRLETEPGKMTGPTSRGVAYLISQAQQQPWANQTWQTASMDNPRVVILPVVDWDEAGSGQTQVTIKSFAIFYLEGIRNRSVTGFFLRYFNLENGEYDSGVPDPTTDGGVRTVRLIE